MFLVAMPVTSSKYESNFPFLISRVVGFLALIFPSVRGAARQGESRYCCALWCAWFQVCLGALEQKTQPPFVYASFPSLFCFTTSLSFYFSLYRKHLFLLYMLLFRLDFVWSRLCLSLSPFFVFLSGLFSLSRSLFFSHFLLASSISLLSYSSLFLVSFCVSTYLSVYLFICFVYSTYLYYSISILLLSLSISVVPGNLCAL